MAASTNQTSGMLDTIQGFTKLPEQMVPNALKVDVCDADRSEGFLLKILWNWIAPGYTLLFLFITAAVWFHNHKTALKDEDESAAKVWKDASTTLFYWAGSNLVAYLLIVMIQRYYKRSG